VSEAGQVEVSRTVTGEYRMGTDNPKGIEPVPNFGLSRSNHHPDGQHDADDSKELQYHPGLHELLRAPGIAAAHHVMRPSTSPAANR
jgi:hypothetical protein